MDMAVLHLDPRVWIPWEYEAILCVIGERGVGKTSLTKRFAAPEDGEDEYMYGRQVDLNGKCINMTINTLNEKLALSDQFWLLNSYCDGILLVYSVTDKYSFEKLSWWIDEAKTRCEGDNIPIVLVGNKCDEVAKTVVDFPTAWDFATEKNLPLVEVSAKDGTNVELAFITLLSMTIHKLHRVVDLDVTLS